MTIETEACTSEMDAIIASFSLAQIWAAIDKYCWVGKETMRLISMVTSSTSYS
jgi:hypothetical protein